jgi:hypothetical protein
MPLNPLRTALLTACLCTSTAFADRDIPSLTMGRVSAPGGSGVVELNTNYSMSDLRQAVSDTNSAELEFEYGVDDRLSLSAGLDTDPVPRDRLQLNQLTLGARYRLVTEPLQIAPFLGFGPQFDERGWGVSFGVATLKRWGSVMVGLDYNGNLTAFGERPTWLHQLDLGVFYAFGLNGVVGASLVYQLPRELSVTAILGGRINRHVFLGVQTQSAVAGPGPALTVTLQLHFYFGPYVTPGLE